MPDRETSQVQVTEEMVEVAARTLWTMRTESSEDLWANGELHGDERAMYCTEAQLILQAALEVGPQDLQKGAEDEAEG